MRVAAIPLLLGFLSQPAMAQQDFQCVGATVSIFVDTASPIRSSEGAEVVLLVERGPRSTILRYSGIDFIGGACDTEAKSGPRIIYQAFCAGSGCDDVSNWGVINPDSLQVLQIPAVGNLDSVSALLGHRPRLYGEMLDVGSEAQRQGLPTP